MKSGTTSLAESLESQTNTVFPCGKEPRVLSCPEDKYRSEIQKYVSSMNGASEHYIVADASPQYTFRGDKTPARAADVHGKNTCVVYVLRDPISRAWSHFQHAWHQGWRMGKTADLAFQNEIVLFSVSDYITHYERWIYHYPKLLVFRFEDIISNPNDIISAIAENSGSKINKNHITISHGNPSSLQGNLRVPDGLVHTARVLKSVPGFKKLTRSRPMVQLRGNLTKQTPPPRPSLNGLNQFRDLIAPKCEQLYAALDWDDTKQWDLDRTIEKICHGVKN